MDKAEATAARIGRLDPAEGHGVEAALAEKRKQYGAAEEQLRKAIEASPKDIDRLIDLAQFLTRRGRIQEADQCIERAERMGPDIPRLLYAKADLYIQQKRNLEVARGLLKRYLNSNLTPDDPPRADAAKLLRAAM
jgi:tetratricopeptide (TPR) repeat protein